jgi:hypothetical protein
MAKTSSPQPEAPSNKAVVSIQKPSSKKNPAKWTRETQKTRPGVRDIAVHILSSQELQPLSAFYTSFPGRESTIQNIVHVLYASGFLERDERGHYRAVGGHEANVRLRETEANEERLLSEVYQLREGFAQILDELNQLRLGNLQASQDMLERRRLENENAALRAEIERLKGQGLVAVG